MLYCVTLHSLSARLLKMKNEHGKEQAVGWFRQDWFIQLSQWDALAADLDEQVHQVFWIKQIKQQTPHTPTTQPAYFHLLLLPQAATCFIRFSADSTPTSSLSDEFSDFESWGLSEFLRSSRMLELHSESCFTDSSSVEGKQTNSHSQESATQCTLVNS